MTDKELRTEALARYPIFLEDNEIVINTQLTKIEAFIAGAKFMETIKAEN